MEIKTRYDVKDTVYFLTTIQSYHDEPEPLLKQGELFVCKAEIGSIDIKANYNGKYDIIYSVYIRISSGGTRNIKVHEDFCAPNHVQLGLDVQNRYYKSGEKNKK